MFFKVSTFYSDCWVDYISAKIRIIRETSLPQKHKKWTEPTGLSNK